MEAEIVHDLALLTAQGWRRCHPNGEVCSEFPARCVSKTVHLPDNDQAPRILHGIIKRELIRCLKDADLREREVARFMRQARMARAERNRWRNLNS